MQEARGYQADDEPQKGSICSICQFSGASCDLLCCMLGSGRISDTLSRGGGVMQNSQGFP